MKRTKLNLWRGWRKEAARVFNITPGAALLRFKNAEPDMMDWIDLKLKKIERAEKIKENIVNNTPENSQN